MRRRKGTVGLFEEIRREYEFGVGTIQGVARKLGVHCRLVRPALNDAVPVVTASPRTRPRLEPVANFIDAILEADRQRRGSSGTPRIGSSSESVKSGPDTRSQSQRFGSTPESGKQRWSCWRGRRSCRRANPILPRTWRSSS
jgi:hypothetical protein